MSEYIFYLIVIWLFLRHFLSRLFFPFNAHLKFTSLLNLRPIISDLKPFGWSRSLAHFWWEYHFWFTSFLFTRNFSGIQLGSKTRSWCTRQFVCYVILQVFISTPLLEDAYKFTLICIAQSRSLSEYRSSVSLEQRTTQRRLSFCL